MWVVAYLRYLAVSRGFATKPADGEKDEGC
jgi:hypothetical protein